MRCLTLGRYVRNSQNRIVPASIAGAELLQAVIAGDEHRDVRLPATAHPYAAPLADAAGVGRVPQGKELVPEQNRAPLRSRDGQ